MKKKKHDLRFHTRKHVFSMYWIQIASILTFYTVYYVLKSIFRQDTFVEQLFLSLFTEATICFMAYKRAWLIGDFHSGEVLTGGSPLKKKHGILLGVLMVAPIWICMVFSSVFKIFNVDIGLFDTVLNLFVFRWSGVVEYITKWTKGSSIVGLLVYCVVCLPLVATAMLGFKNGFLGIYEGIKFKKNYAPRYENEGARDFWNKA